MRRLALVAAASLLALAASGVQVISTHSRLRAQPNTEASAGLACRLGGVVTHVSALRPNLFVFAPIASPGRYGVMVRLGPGLKLPKEGEEIVVSGKALPTREGLVLVADGITVIRTRVDLGHATRPLKVTDLSRDVWAWRRVTMTGTAREIVPETRDGRAYTSLRVVFDRHFVLVKVPGRLKAADFDGRHVRVTGCIFPTFDAKGNYVDSTLELARIGDIVRLETDWPAIVLTTLGTLVSLALLVVTFLWWRVRRAKLRMEIVSAERKRMARDLHDTIEQYLASVRLVLAGTLKQTDLPPKAQASLVYASEVLASAKAEVRDAVMNLRSDDAYDRPPAEDLGKMALDLTRGGQVEVKAAFNGFPERLKPSIFQDLMLIVREAVTNAIKHGHAKHVIIAGNGNVLRILNDGEPFDATRALGPETGHFGLSGMRERAQRSGFEISWGNEDGMTCVRIAGV